MVNKFSYHREFMKKIDNAKFISINVKKIIIYYTINSENEGE